MGGSTPAFRELRHRNCDFGSSKKTKIISSPQEITFHLTMSPVPTSGSNEMNIEVFQYFHCILHSLARTIITNIDYWLCKQAIPPLVALDFFGCKVELFHLKAIINFVDIIEPFPQ